MNNGRVLRRADASTIQNKFLVGYQGWFTCAGDGEPIDRGHHGWLHWMNYPVSDGGRPNTDLWPDISEYTEEELYDAPGINYHDGQPAKLFSSRHPRTVDRHFHWLAIHGVDGVFLQRFLSVADPEHRSKGIRRLRDEIGLRVREAAESQDRVWAMMYDVSGVDSARVMSIFTRDWLHLIRDERVLESPNYLRENGRPVIALWGFGFREQNHTPELVREVTTFIRENTPGGAYIMAGTPTHWRTSAGDASSDPAFLPVWLSEFDAISPWMVGRLRNEEKADEFANGVMKDDLELLRKEAKRKVDYVPVVYPGFSGLNLSEGKWGFNQIKRNGGRLLWQQIFNAKRLGLKIMYGAMWDEYDEGTALMPVVPKSRLLPHTENDKYPFMALDVDGYDVPADWYMRICGFAAEGLRSERMIHETFPSKELQDYWATRPRYEPEVNTETNSGDNPDAGGQFQSQNEGKEDTDTEPPPPPYSLEAEPVAVASTSQSQAHATADSSSASQNQIVASLASDLSRQSISSPSTSLARPPLHPSHSSRTSPSGSSAPLAPPPTHPSSRPHPRAGAGTPPEPNRLSRPQSISVSRPLSASASRPQTQIQTPSSPQWPLTESSSGPNRPSSVPYQTYQPNGPQSDAFLGPTAPSSRPTSPYDPQNGPFNSIRPQQPSGTWYSPQANVAGSPQQSSGTWYPSQANVVGSPPGTWYSSQANVAGSPSLPHASPSSGPATSSSYYSHSHPSHPSFPSGSYGPTSTQPPQVPYSSHPSPSQQAYAVGSFPSMTMPETGPHSPAAGEGFPDATVYGPPPSQPYQMAGPSSSPGPSSYNDAPGFWSTATSSPIPPHRPPPSPYPGSYDGYNYSQQMPAPSSKRTASLTNYARSAVDKVAGQDTRQHLESKLGSLAHSGSKLLGRFSNMWEAPRKYKGNESIWAGGRSELG